MKRLTHHIILIILLVYPMGPVLAGTESLPDDASRILTLARARQIAYANSPTLAAAMERIEQAREDVTQARASYLPTLAATAGWNYSEATDSLSSGVDETRYTHQLSVSQVLFDGFQRRYSALSARYGLEKSLAAEEDARRLLSWSVAQAFLNCQLAMENMNIARSDMDFNKNQEDAAAAREKAGTGSLSDVLNFKTQVNSGKSNLLTATLEYVSAMTGLAALLGYDDARIPADMRLATLDREAPLPDELPLEATDTELESIADQRSDLKEAALSVADAGAGIRIAQSDYFPNLSLTGTYGTTDGDGFDDTKSMGASFGITLRFELFSGGITTSRVSQARSGKREREHDLKNARITALSEIRTAMNKLSTACEQLGLQKENTRLVEQVRDLVVSEYQVGQASLVRLNEAQNDLVIAMGSLAAAQVNLELAMAEYAYYTGQDIH